GSPLPPPRRRARRSVASPAASGRRLPISRVIEVLWKLDWSDPYTRSMRNIGILIVASMAACGGGGAGTRPAPRPAAPPPVALMRPDRPPGCMERASIMKAIGWGDVEGARRNLRKKAAAMGANYVRLELPSSGTAYWCPPAPAGPDTAGPYVTNEQPAPL